MNKILYILINSVFVSFLYLGFIKGDEDIKQYAIYFVWFFSALSFLMYFYMYTMSPENKKQECLKAFSKRSIDYRLDIAIDLAFFAFFLYYSAYWTAFAYFFIAFVSADSSIQALKHIKEDKDAENKNMKFF